MRESEETTDFVSQSISLLIVALLAGLSLLRPARLPFVLAVSSELFELIRRSSRELYSDCVLFGILLGDPCDVDSVVDVLADLLPIEPEDDNFAVR